jgi:hypothetical protein
MNHRREIIRAMRTCYANISVIRDMGAPPDIMRYWERLAMDYQQCLARYDMRIKG